MFPAHLLNADDLPRNDVRTRFLFAGVDEDQADSDTDGYRLRRYFAEARLKLNRYYRYGQLGVDTRVYGSSKDAALLDSVEGSSTREFVELRQLFFKRNDVFNTSGLSWTIGRQRYKDEQSHWWDTDIEGFQLAINRSLFDGFLAVAEKSMTFRSDRSDTPNSEQDDILRLFGRLRWQYQPRHFFESRWHLQHDHSSDSIDDVEDFDGLWLGNRLRGKTQDNITYSSEVILQAGKASQASEGQTQNVLAWAILLDLEKSMSDSPYHFGINWHRTSAGNLGSKTGFRRTQLDSMAWQNKGAVSPQRYGEASRMGLTNLDAKGVYARYSNDHFSALLSTTWLARVDTHAEVFSRSIDLPLLPGEKDLGYNIDLILSKQWQVSFMGVKQVTSSLRWGNFFPGRAYQANASHYSRIQLELIGRL